MACIIRGDWIVPRKLMCFLFWTGTILLFAGILLVVTSKHKGSLFLLWGAVLLGLGSCILLVCLALCVHAYYVIAESRSNAEHSLIDHLQLQRKAQYSAPSCSSDIDGIWEVKPDSYPGLNGRATTAHSNGHCSTSDFRQLTVPLENGIHVRHQSYTSGDGTLDNNGKRIRKSSELVLKIEREEESDSINRSYENKCFSDPPTPPDSPIPPPPSYSSQFSPKYCSSPNAYKIAHTSRSPAVTPDQGTPSRPGSHQSDERSSRASIASTPSRPKTLSSSALSVSRATRVDHPPYPHHQSPVFRNTSSHSSAQNSSTDFDNGGETTDAELGHALGTPLPFSSGRHPKTPHRETRPLNNTPVNCYQTDTAEGSDHDTLLGRTPSRLNFDPMTYDHVDRREVPHRVTPKIPSDNEAEVWTTGTDTLLSRRPPQTGLRRPPGPSSITRPFGHGSVTVTPLYPKTPPSQRHNTVAAGVTVRASDGVRSVTPKGGVLSARSPDGVRATEAVGSRTVPTVSVTPCIADREIDIGVCESDVTVYDNVNDVVRM